MTVDDIRTIDKDAMYDAVRDFPQQWREGRRRAIGTDLSAVPREGYHQVVIAGMGGSAIGGELLRTLALDTATVPISISRSYRLPAWVGRETVVIVSSYSGNTEETLSAMDQAIKAECFVICLTTGGGVLDKAREHGLPYIQMPATGLQPRAALGYSLSALLTVAERMLLIPPDTERWVETQALLQEQSEQYNDPAAGGNKAFQLAQALEDKLPCVYSSDGLLEGVNLRWRNQIQENSKTFAVGNVFPEMNHNEIMGWERHSAILSQLGVVVLRDKEDHPRVQRRIDVTRNLLAERAGFWTEVRSHGTSKLARLMSVLYFGDWVSLYLALLLEVDPTPIPLINKLKDALAET